MINSIFVFGSNTQGRHGKGGALTAKLNHGAIYGQAEGLQGNSYAIITKELRPNFPPVTLEDIKVGIDKFIQFAKWNPSLDFKVTKIGGGLAGFNFELDILPMFQNEPDNIWFA